MKKIVFIIFVVVLIVGCHSPSVTRGRDDSSIDEAALSTGIDMADWNYAISKVVESMKSYPFFGNISSGTKSTVAVSDFINESPEHVNTGFLRALLEKEILKTGKFRLVEEEKRGKLLETMLKQNTLTDLFDASTVATKGKQFGVQFFFQGKILGQVERTSDKRRTQFLVVVEIVNISTAEKIFKETVPVTKQLH